MYRIIAILLVCLSSNALFGQRDFYIPKVPITPFHNQPKQLKVSFGFDRGVCSDISYSLNNLFTIYTSGSYDFLKIRRSQFLGDDYYIKKNDISISSGITYRCKILKYSIEYIAGAGYTRVDNHEYPVSDEDYDEYTKSNYLSTFIQFNISKKVERLEHGVALRVSISKYLKLIYLDVMYGDEILYKFQNFNLVCFEPAFFVSGELFKDFFVNAQLGFSMPLNGLELNALIFRNDNNKPSTFTSDNVEQLIPFAKISFQFNFSF